MNQLAPHDIGIAPLYLMRGRPALHQSIICHVWAATLRGQKWTLKGLAEDAGSSGATVRRVLDQLANFLPRKSMPRSGRP